MRFHMVFYPLVILAIWGSFLRVLIYLFSTNRSQVQRETTS